MILKTIETRITRGHHVWRKFRKQKRIAPQVGQVRHHLAVQHLAVGSGGSFHQRNLLLHLHAFAYLAHFQFAVDGEKLLGSNDDAAAVKLFEPRRFHRNGIGGGIDGAKNVVAGRVAKRGSGHAGCCIQQRYFCVGNGSPRWILNRAAQSPLKRLRKKPAGKQTEYRNTPAKKRECAFQNAPC